MLNQGDGVAQFFVGIQDEPGDILLLFQVHAGHGFVQEEELGLCGQGPCQFHSFPETVREHAGRCPADVLDLEEINDPLYRLSVLDLLFPAETPVNPLRKDVGMHLHGPPHHDVPKG